MGKKLPKNWTQCTIGELSNIIRGVTYGKSDARPNKGTGDVLILRGGNIQDGKVDLSSDEVFVKSALIKDVQKIFRGDVIIVGSTGSSKLIGKAAIIHEDLEDISFGAFLMLLRPNQLINSKYFDYYFLSDYYRETIRQLAGGVNINNIRKEYIENLLFPLPPLPEQQRIVVKLDSLFAQHEIIKAAMDKIPVLLKDFRQQVLTQAVTGKLTEEWRKNKYNDDWRHFELNQIVPKGGIFDGPFGSHLKTEDYTLQGVRVIRLENIEHLFFIEGKETYISEEKYLRLVRHSVGEGDIIFSSFISENIRACILPPLNTKAIAKADCFCIRVDTTVVMKEFLLYVLTSKNTYNQLVSHIHGATRPRINTTQLKKLSVHVPELLEQKEIISRVESLFAKADAIEAQYKSLKDKIDKLPQSILHKAFKGELSEQLESDGDARGLLEKITALKENLPKKGKKYKDVKQILGMVAEAK